MTFPRPPGSKSPAAPARSGNGGTWGRAQAKPTVEERLAHPGLAVRMAAAQILADVIHAGHSVDERFTGEQVHQKLTNLDARDRSLVRSIVTVSMRRLGTLRKSIGQFLERGMPRKSGMLEWILIVGAAQILFLDIPDHAAVDLAVRGTRTDPQSSPFASLANAVLRNIARARDQLLADSDPLRDDTPSWLAARWRANYGEERAAAIAAANRREPTLDLTVKSDAQGWAAKLDGLVLPTGSIRLRTHDAVGDLEGYADGEWWVQDASAALPARLLHAQPGERIADLCAAPGGKTSELIAAGADVVAVDRSAERLKRLSVNLARLRYTADIKVADVLAFEAAPFDAILLDAPCTSTGTIRRHPDVAWAKKISDLAPLAHLQAQLLDKALRLLKPGGRLVYCTCSLEPEEGEHQIAALFRRNPDVLRMPITAVEIGGLAECLTPEGDLRSLPFHLAHDEPRLAGMDGFFAARLIRRQ